MKKMPSLNEEIAAMAKSDSTGMTSDLSIDSNHYRDDEKQSNSNTKASSSDVRKRNKSRSRAKLVQEIRISVRSDFLDSKRMCLYKVRIIEN